MKKILKIVVPVAMLIALASCSTTSKNKSSFKSKTDVAIDEKKGIDTTKTSTSDLQKKEETETTTGNQQETDVQKMLNINFGNGTAEDYTGITSGKIVKPADTLLNNILVRTTGQGTVKLNADGSIEATGNIKNINYQETGKTKKKDSTRTKSSTDTRLQVKNENKGIDTTVKKEVTQTETVIKTKDVKRTSYWGYLWFLLIPAVWIAGWWLGLWPLIPKRKKRDEYPVKYSDYKPPKSPAS